MPTPARRTHRERKVCPYMHAAARTTRPPPPQKTNELYEGTKSRKNKKGMKNARREPHTTKGKYNTHKKNNKNQTCTSNTTAPAAETQGQVCYMPRYATLQNREKHNENHTNKGDQEV